MDFASIFIKADSSQVRRASKDLGSMSMASSGLTKAVKALLPALTAVLSARALLQMAKEAREFGAAMGEVSTLLNNMDELPRLTAEAKELAKTFGGSPTSQAKAFYQAISAGAGSAAEATEILTTANKLAIGGVTDVTTAVDGLTTIVNAFGLETKESMNVSDAFFVAMKAGKTTVGELSSSIGKAAAIASSAGLSYEELLGSISALTTGGIQTSEAVTGLKAALSNILKPSKEAADVAAALGLQFNQAGLEADGLQGFLQKVVAKTGGSKQALISLFGSVEALNTVFALTGGSAEAFTEIMEDMGGRTGETEKAFTKVSDTMDHKLTVLSGKLSVARVEIGEFLLTLAEPIVDHLNQNSEDYYKMLEAIQAETREIITWVREIWGFLADDIGGFLNEVNTRAGELLSQVGARGETVTQQLTNAFNDSMAMTRTAGENTRTFFANTWARITGNTNESTATMEQDIMSVVNSTEEMTTRIEGFVGPFEQMTTRIQGFVGPLQNTSREMANVVAQTGLASSNINGFTGELDLTVPSLEATGRSAEEAEAIIAGLGDEVDDTSDSFDVWSEMLEGIQNNWANLIYDLLDEGKFRFKDFFDVVIDGFKRMVAEMAAADLMNAIFGGQGLSALTGGNLANLGSNIIGMVTGNKSISQGVSSIAGIGLTASAISSLSSAGASIAGSLGIGTLSTTAGWVAPSMASPATIAAATGGTASGGLLSSIGSGLSSAAAGVGKFLSAIPGWGWALAGAGLLASVLDDSGTYSHNAGFLTSRVPGADPSRLFEVPAFASGFQPIGLNRRSSIDEATAVIDVFRAYDQKLTDAITALGYNVNLSNAFFDGYDEKGRGYGAFFGSAYEDGGKKGVDINTQLSNYVGDYLREVAKMNGVPYSAVADIIGLGSADKMLTAVESLVPQGSYASGLHRVPYDGFIAELHKGERVLTSSEASNMDGGGPIAHMLVSIINYMIKLFNIVDRWDQNGIPAERTTP